MNRRSFLILGGASALAPLCGAETAATKKGTAAERVALDGPLTGADSPLLKAVTFTKLTLNVGAAQSFTAIHCSDTHLNFMTIGDLLSARVTNDLPMYDGRRTQINALVPFAACVLKARLLNAPLLHTGDVWDYHSAANGLIAQDAFLQAGDVFYAIGNHELYGHWKTAPAFDEEAWRTKIQSYLPNPIVCASRVIHGVNFVAFDDTGSGRAHHDEIVRFVSTEFKKKLPVVLMVHQPFLTDEIYADLTEAKGPFVGDKKMPKVNFSGWLYGSKKREREFIDWMLSQSNLKVVLCGHLHAEAQYRLTEAVTQYCAGAVRKGNAYEITFC